MVTKGSVLVVDDEINLCRIIGAKLTRNGYTVVAVHDGLQAVQKVRESDFDVVLLDLILPKMDGLAALAEIRSVRDALPVIVMTACENAETLEQARSYGVSAYVNKPFDLDNLVSLVTNTSQSGVPTRKQKLPDSTVLFAAHQPVTLEIQNGSCPKVCCTSIAGKDERTLSLYAPRLEGAVLQVSPRTSVKVGLAARDAFYSFTTQVLRSNGNAEPVLVLEKPNVIYRVQRREHPRFALRVPVEYTLFRDDPSEETEFLPGETRDLSMGGACIVTSQEVLPGEMLRVELRPKNGKDKISTVARVMRSRTSTEPDEPGYVLGCRFILAEGPLGKLLKA